MKEYIEKILHRDIGLKPYEDKERLPLSIQGSYELYLITIGEKVALLASPKEKTPLVTLRKQQHQLELYTGLPCVLYVKEMNYYMRDAMLDEGIPFVWEGHQLYLPFAGILLDEPKRKAVPGYVCISYLTQKLLLTSLYEGWQKVTVTRAAEKLNVSKMSVTRCFDELEALNVPYLSLHNRTRTLNADTNKKNMWENIHEVLRNPVLKNYAIKELPDRKLPFSGETALAHYSMLDDGLYPFLGITKSNLKELDLSLSMLSPSGEVPVCVVQELGYWISYEDGKAVDPLTVSLSISKDAKEDPRISMAIDEMLEEYVW